MPNLGYLFNTPCYTLCNEDDPSRKIAHPQSFNSHAFAHGIIWNQDNENILLFNLDS